MMSTSTEAMSVADRTKLLLDEYKMLVDLSGKLWGPVYSAMPFIVAGAGLTLLNDKLQDHQIQSGGAALFLLLALMTWIAIIHCQHNAVALHIVEIEQRITDINKLGKKDGLSWFSEISGEGLGKFRGFYPIFFASVALWVVGCYFAGKQVWEGLHAKQYTSTYRIGFLVATIAFVVLIMGIFAFVEKATRRQKHAILARKHDNQSAGCNEPGANSALTDEV